MPVVTLTGDNRFYTISGMSDTQTTVVRFPFGSLLKIVADDAIKLFNGVASDATPPVLPNHIELSATEGPKGWWYTGDRRGDNSGGEQFPTATLCMASAAGLSTNVRLTVEAGPAQIAARVST